ncbi:solute carrier family 25 member 16-like [Physella acuta]|uniref:solute carrier family 25 member 16-like n=1 Tax=Physella acuta TaxID=109671 RepID=UPI0027DC71E0|nr:solute carrier family 25 member 16-like [Physella acuta]XP_059139156.1 solute carrier family 25 member 16-like [Physella acuta]XP_059139157.1 solute carrier family 25 member 16-like [Physella acuta]XP_059139158.1 solute carrier family 25 member 16-like [Physella acuta]XP_059139159.1 solute carrier family 25 member 16-like [Physella acuta]XP_059139160.1 solute carrier family 25 member 16-like [Physella acuta]XP_059139161.1 solute carrier family 25 member 16-like [Physella acuta]XP_05913916
MAHLNESKDSKAVVAVKTFISGGLAGIFAKTAVAPLDRVKILLQAHNQHYKHLGVFSTLSHVISREGFKGLYQGNGVQMLRIFPYAAIQFLSYEQFKKMAKYVPIANQSPNLCKLICGSLAGLTAVLITYPLDMIRARLAFQVKGEAIYQGILHTIQSIRHFEGGTRGLYQGIVPTILGMAPYAGLSFSSFEILKNFALDTFPELLSKPCPQNTGGLVLILPAKLVCGGLAGAIAQTISYPLDVVRRRMQLSGMVKTSPEALVHYQRSWLRVMVDVYQENGVVRGLYRGMSINYIRIMPTVAISFATYESAKQAFGLDTGVDR